MITLWSMRYTIARGWEWTFERRCSEVEAQAWLGIFEKDEPAVEFVLSLRKPKALKAKDMA